MCNYILIIALVLGIFSSSCKTKKSAKVAATSTTQFETTKDKTIGKVSHQFRPTGCTTVIVVDRKGEANQLILIPKDAIPHELDIDGMEIYFKHRPLKIPQPKGCSKGIPADITEIEKKK